MSSKSKGILFIVLAALSFALMNTCVRLAGDINTFEKAFFRNFVAALITGVIMLRQHVPTKLSRESRRLVLGRVVLGTLGLVCNFYAVSRINLADANMLNKMSPFFAVVFSALLLKEKLSLRQLLIVLGAFAASLLIINRQYNRMVAIQNGQICSIPLEEAASRTKFLPVDHPMIQVARDLGICMGD